MLITFTTFNEFVLKYDKNETKRIIKMIVTAASMVLFCYIIEVIKIK